VIAAKAAGDAALLLETGADGPAGGPAGLSAAIRAAALPGLIDIVPGAQTVLVTFEPGSWSPDELAGQLASLRELPWEGRDSGTVTEISVVYDGPDLADVSTLTGLTAGQVVARHTEAVYQVGWLGFSPGFGYLTGLDPLLAAVPRLDSPRLAVPAGSVAIAGGLAAVYPAASPGGWRLLGRTTARLWDLGRDQPALLSPGMRVRFRAVDRLPDGPAPPDYPGRPAEPQPGLRFIEVIQPGPLTTVQDLGRPGLAHLGVPGSGAADPASLRLANELVGNRGDDACLELTLGRLAVRFGADATAALAGAHAPMRLIAADESVREPGPDSAFSVPAGSVLRVGPPVAGLRSYLAIGGGIEAPAVLGSRSADSLSGIGPEPLRAGARLTVGPPRAGSSGRPGAPPPQAAGPVPLLPSMAASSVELRAVAGPRDDWFTAQALDTLASCEYQVSAASNRTGLRLSGPALERAWPGELPSEGIATGSVQVTHDGQPILLLADHPTTGGYPVIAVVRSADLGLAAQLRPGQRIRFSLTRP
jgi:KipI family sensor histidine kinase inhibitor